MANRYLALAAFLCIVFIMRIEAATVSFLVIETGLEPETSIRSHSGLWESGLLDEFFNAGHIVSNAPILRIYDKPDNDIPEEALSELNGAIEGGADFFILALLDYESRLQVPDRVSLKMFRIGPIKKIYDQQFVSRRPNSTREEFDSIKLIARGLVPHLNNR